MPAPGWPARLLRTLSTCLASLLLGLHPAVATPILFHTNAYQSPVRVEPDDLLMLAGYGFSADDTVVYQRIDNSTKTPSHPQATPAEATVSSGVAPIVSTLGIPNSLTVRLPQAMQRNQTYAFWIRTASGDWSEAVQINDARPLWISPAYVYVTASVASLPRYLKVIGRNLQAADGQNTRVKLTGPQAWTLSAERSSPADLDEFVARVSLPTSLTAGRYRISVSRDGSSWVPLTGQLLEVRTDPSIAKAFRIDDPAFGGCKPDDGKDDAPCLFRAIAAATTNGGVITLTAGTWDLIDAKALGITRGEGLRLPNGVQLRGAGSSVTTLIRHPQWNADARHPAFTLQGNNDIRGIKFNDSETYANPGYSPVAPLLQLGMPYELAAKKKDARVVADIVIADNIFDKPNVAISNAGLPIKNLFIVNNEFGAFYSAIRLAGDRFNMIDEFRIDDSVIAYNQFYPGSWLDVARRQGTLATELGAGHRVDFSHNQADGSAIKYLNDPTDARGWRAGFFWNLTGNQELLLISANELSCTGDKVGDGEAISYDNNGNIFAFDTPKKILGSTTDSITVNGPLLAQQNNRDVVTTTYYIGHWIQIGAGPGLGQVRKIVSYEIDERTQNVTFKISPAWDVIPVPNDSQISIGREFWQVYTVANTIDHRTPLCQKSNRSDPKGGGISIWAQTADSVVAGNRQFDSDGILFHNQFTARDTTCKDCYRGSHFVSFLDIRNNVIDGEYDWESDCSSSGIDGSLAAGPGTPPLTVNYGLSISHNVINHADAVRGGAIATTPGWFEGPAPHRWPLVDGVLVHHNVINGMWSSRARSCRNQPSAPRTAISLGNSSLVFRPVLYANSCGEVPQANNLSGAQQVTKVCTTDLSDACECKR